MVEVGFFVPVSEIHYQKEVRDQECRGSEAPVPPNLRAVP